MTEIALTRSPLQALSMSSSQRPPRRRSARLAFDEEESGSPSKRTRTDENASANTSSAPKSPTKGRKPALANQKPKGAYEEDVDGFTFARSNKTKNSKARTKTSLPPPPPTADESSHDNLARKKTPNPRRRSARLSGEKLTEGKGEGAQALPEKVERLDQPGPSRHEEPKTGRSPNQLHIEKKRGPTKIALPFADTPIIARNKAMRKSSADTNRRSSSQLRGRRASSLMDSGSSSALPHSEVEAIDFYKHISQDLSEPRRMKQLLVWCATRALVERPTGGSSEVNAALAARVIKEELLKDFSNKGELSDWFSRDDAAPTVLLKKPNPRNTQNAAKLRELEHEAERLKQEQKHWEDMIQSLSYSAEQEDGNSKKQADQELTASSFNKNLLSTSEQASLRDVSSATLGELKETTDRLGGSMNDLEFRIDHFAERIHRVARFQETVNGLVDQVLSGSAQTLGEKDKAIAVNAGTEKVGVRDLLRSLSRTG